MSSETTTSPTPISPFFSESVHSEPTSDENPDLGAFTTVFRALNHLQPPRQLAFPIAPSSILLSPSELTPSEVELDSDSLPHPGSTVWSHLPIASYLKTPTSPTLEEPPSDTTEHELLYSDFGAAADIDDPSSDIDTNPDQPSLGYLDEALSFLAAERARILTFKPVNSDSPWRHVVEPRRKRRRKKTPSGAKSSSTINEVQILLRDDIKDTETTGQTEVVVSIEQTQDADDSSSSLEFSSSGHAYFKSTPATPPKHHNNLDSNNDGTNHKRLTHSRSTPSLLPPPPPPTDLRVLRLRKLAHKLRLLFPPDAAGLARVLTNIDTTSNSDPDAFVDPRGPIPKLGDRPVHVFIDHSNILIGFLTHLKRHPSIALSFVNTNTPTHLPSPSRHPHPTKRRHKPPHLSHAALTLLFERGRPTARRVLVTSSPLYQPMDDAYKLAYEVRVYARVPDTGDGADRQRSRDNERGGWRKGRGHAHKTSGGGNTSTSAESDSPVLSKSPGGPTSTQQPGRIRYREQGVDELLQLKLHQALAAEEGDNPGTIVLATGDGNVGEYSEEGFLGPVRAALRKGWNVELYAWEEGLSRAWRREFGPGSPWAERFRIIGMEAFAEELLEV